jgi:hypothetical protein
MSCSPYGCPPDEILSAQLTESVNKTYGVAGWTTILFDTLVWDTGDFYAAGVPNTFTAPSDGYYLVGGNLGFTLIGATQQRSLRVLKAGATQVIYRTLNLIVGTTPTFTLDGLIKLVAGDTLVMQILATATAVVVASIAEYSPRFWIAKLASS